MGVADGTGDIAAYARTPREPMISQLRDVAAGGGILTNGASLPALCRCATPDKGGGPGRDSDGGLDALPWSAATSRRRCRRHPGIICSPFRVW